MQDESPVPSPHAVCHFKATRVGVRKFSTQRLQGHRAEEQVRCPQEESAITNAILRFLIVTANKQVRKLSSTPARGSLTLAFGPV